MAIVKRGSSYQVKVRGHDGAWWTSTCRSKQAAQKLERQMYEARDLGQAWIHPRDRQQRLTVRTMCERYTEAHARRLARSTLVQRARHLERWCAWGAAIYPRGFLSTHLSRALMERWAEERLADGNGIATVRTLIQSALSVWSWAYDYDEELGWEGLIPRYRRPALPRTPRAVVLAPTWAEVDAMIAQLGPAWARRSAILQRYMGTRIGETLLLRWSDLVELDAGGLAFHLRAATTKGGYGARLIPVHEDLGARLGRWSRDHDLVVGPRAVKVRKHQGYAARTYSRAWKASGARPQVYKLPTHCLRKCFKTQLLAAGCPQLEVGLLLGHGLAQVDRAYVDTSTLNLSEVIARIPALSADVPA